MRSTGKVGATLESTQKDAVCFDKEELGLQMELHGRRMARTSEDPLRKWGPVCTAVLYSLVDLEYLSIN